MSTTYFHDRLISNDEVTDLPNNVNYGSTTDNSRSVPMTSRTRKYSESVGRSYVASAVARYDTIRLRFFKKIVNSCPSLPVIFGE